MQASSASVTVPRELFDTMMDDMRFMLDEIKKYRPGTYRASGTITELEGLVIGEEPVA